MTRGNEMSEVQYWSSLRGAWQATEGCVVSPISEAVAAPARADNSWQLIKSETRVRLILLDPEPPHPRVVLKIYRIPGHLAWRTFGMVSRANREFTALMEAHQRGLPVVRPVSWLEARSLGCLNFSAISLELVRGINLEDVLKDNSTSVEQRLKLAQETGVLLAGMHRQGMVWGTAYPRNVLIQEDHNDRLLVIDTPYAQWHSNNLLGSTLAMMDLRGMVRSKGGGWGFKQLERQALLTGYCADDPGLAVELRSLLVPHSTRQSKLERLKKRSANVLISSPRSKGHGGIYRFQDGGYQQLDSNAVSIV